MPAKTHSEMVLEEIVRQWPDRVEARARLIGRPLGFDPVSDKRARELYWQRNENVQAVLMAVAEQPDMSDTQITWLIYPSRKDVLDGIKNERGWKGMVRFDEKMQREGPPGIEEPGEASDAVRSEY